MSSAEHPDESGVRPNEIDLTYVRELFDRMAQAPFVMCVRELEVRDPDVIIAFDVQTRFGWTNVLAVSASTDAERLIGSLHIRTKFPTLSTPTDEGLARAQKFAVLTHYARAEGEAGIEAQSRLPIFADRAVFNALVPTAEQIIRLQGSMLTGYLQDRLRAQHAIWAMGPHRPSREGLQVAYESLRNAINPDGFRVVEIDTGCVVMDDDDDVSTTDAYRVEVATDFSHPLFGSLTCAELVVPWTQSRGGDAHEAAALLNRSEEALEDETLGVGAWYARSEDGSLRFRILLPFTEQWTPYLELFVASLVLRWMNIKDVNPGTPSDFGMVDGLRSLFSSLRSGSAPVLRVEHSEGGQLGMQDYYRDLELESASLRWPGYRLELSIATWVRRPGSLA